MRIAIGSDHAGYEYKEIIVKWLQYLSYEVIDFGTDSIESTDYPDYAIKAAEAVAGKEADFGVLICGTGTGMSMAANKVKGIRAASCCSVPMAYLAREHNNANVLCMGARLITIELAKEITSAFLSGKFQGGRHIPRVEKIHSLTGR